MCIHITEQLVLILYIIVHSIERFFTKNIAFELYLFSENHSLFSIFVVVTQYMCFSWHTPGYRTLTVTRD